MRTPEDSRKMPRFKLQPGFQRTSITFSQEARLAMVGMIEKAELKGKRLTRDALVNAAVLEYCQRHS